MTCRWLQETPPKTLKSLLMMTKNPEVLPEGQDKEARTVPEGDHKQVVSEGDKHEGAGHEKQGVSEGDNKQGAGVGEGGAVPSSQANNC